MEERNLKYLLENYFGLLQKEIDNLKSIPSRWVTILQSYPTIAITKKSYFILH
jgi:hypothetical protein